MRVLIQLRGFVLTAGFGFLIAATPVMAESAEADVVDSDDASVAQTDAADSSALNSSRSEAPGAFVDASSSDASVEDQTDAPTEPSNAVDDSSAGEEFARSSEKTSPSSDEPFSDNGVDANAARGGDAVDSVASAANEDSRFSGDDEGEAIASADEGGGVIAPNEEGEDAADAKSANTAVPALATTPAAVQAASATDSFRDSSGDTSASDSVGDDGGHEESAAAQAAQAGLVTPSGLQIVVSSSVQAGLQTDEATHHAQASLSISANYKLHEKIFISGRISPYVELTRMPNDNRRTGFSGNGNTVRLNFRNLFHEKFTDIRLGGSLGYVLPIGYNDIFLGNPRAGSVSGAVQLFRAVGPVMLVGSVGANLPLYLNQRAKLQCDPEQVKEVGASCPSHLWGNRYNSAFSLSSSLLAIYSVGSFSFSGSLQLGTGWTWGPSSANEPHNTNDHANQRFSQGFSFQGAYAINQSWSVNAGFYNSGPQITGEWGRRNPFFNKDFAAVYIGADWVY